MRLSETAKVGLTALLAAGLLVMATFALRGPLSRGLTYTQRVTFPDAQGIQPGAPVRIRGVTVGEVADVSLNARREAEVVLRMRLDSVIGPRDAIRVYGTVFGFGQPFVEITPNGRAAPVSIQGGRAIPGETGLSTANLAAQAETLVDNLNGLIGQMDQLTGSLTEIVEDRQLRRSLNRTVTNFEKASESGVVISRNLAASSGKVDRLVRSFEGTATQLDRTLARAEVLLKDFQGTARQTEGLMKDARGLVSDTREAVKGTDELVKSTKSTVDRAGEFVKNADGLITDTREVIGENRERLGKVFEQLDGTLKQLDGTLAEARSFVADPELRENLKATSANVREASEGLKKITGDVQGLTGDPKLQEDLKGTIANLRDASREAAEVFRRVRGVVGSGGSAVRNASQAIRNTTVRAELGRGLRADRTRLDVDAILPWSTTTAYRLGVFNFGEENKVNVQAASRLRPDVWARYGIHASTLGLGFDLGRPDRPWLSGDLFGVDEPRLDLRGYVPVWGSLDLGLGVNNVFRRANPYVGVRYRHK